jgi:hypothetical protein
MRRALALLLLAAGPLVLLLRRRSGSSERVSLYYADGSSMRLDRGTPGVERVLVLARDAL